MLKAFADERIAAGERLLVVDLENCCGMDSTFMGTLMGLAARLAAQHSGSVHVAGVDQKNQRSLEDLGVDFLVEINPPQAAWHENLTTIRESLERRSSSTPSRTERSNHVLEAHQTLSDASAENAEKFSAVINMLEQDLSAKQKLPDA